MEFYTQISRILREFTDKESLFESFAFIVFHKPYK